MPGRRGTTTASETATVHHAENWMMDTETLHEKIREHNHAWEKKQTMGWGGVGGAHGGGHTGGWAEKDGLHFAF